MSKYVYPAIFTPEENEVYSIRFPDVEGCYTCGDNLADGIEMAEDALALVIYGLEKDGKQIPEATPLDDIHLNKGEFISYIACDTMEYRKMYNNKAIKKTLTIPEWLNEAAAAKNINFSQVLQDALKEKLNVG
ncbi:MAG TPA: type II toxin-antitoxin system HicB family antitoxin [Lachnospiraceae bacterium]|nr:type II toxin-antitoxin system HicB family antitoxin [Lachnospiraceae bacterium]